MGTPSSMLASLDSVEIKMSEGKKESLHGFQTLTVAYLTYCNNLVLVFLPAAYLLSGHFSQRGYS